MTGKHANQCVVAHDVMVPPIRVTANEWGGLPALDCPCRSGRRRRVTQISLKLTKRNQGQLRSDCWRQRSHAELTVQATWRSLSGRVHYGKDDRHRRRCWHCHRRRSAHSGLL